jgi:putative inorganic carbon (HCO3(-)) transporter
MNNPRLQSLAAKLLDYEIWVIGLCVAAGFLSARLLPLALVTGAGFWLLRWLSQRRLVSRTPVDWPVVILAGMALISLLVTIQPEVTQPQVLRLFTGIFFYYAIINWAERPSRLRWLALGAVAGSLGLVAFALIGVQWGGSKLAFIPAALYARFPMLVSDSAHPNVMAGNLAILLPLTLGLPLFAWRQLNWYELLLGGFSTLCILATMVLTQSRGALMAAGTVLVLLVLLRWRWGWVAALLVGLGLVGLAAWYGVTPVLNLVTANVALGGLDGRAEVWSRAIYMIQDFPFTGIGMGTFSKVAELFYPFFLAEPGSIAHAHNLPLQIAVDLGLPGLIAWLSVWGLVAWAAWRVYRWGRLHADAWAAGLGAGGLCVQVALMVHGITDAVTWGMVRPAPIIWAIWGLMVAALLTYTSSARAQNANS